MDYSTKRSFIEKIADFFGINDKFHRYREDKINYDKKFIISPVEATLTYSNRIEKNKRMMLKSKKEAYLEDILGEFANLFSEGFYLNFYLSPKNKHYWRIPYDSRLAYTIINEGIAKNNIFSYLERLFREEYYFEKAIKKNASISSIMQADNFLFAMIAIGSLNVNKIHLIKKKYDTYQKGDIGGYFSIGSSMMLCFPRYPMDLLSEIGKKVNIGEPIIKLK